MEPDAVTLMGFDGMAEGMPEIQRGTNTRLTFVRTHYRRLGGTGAPYGLGQCDLVQLPQPVDIVFKPTEERLIANQTVLDDFRQARRQLTRRQCRQRGRIDQHQLRLVEGTNHVLAQGMIDTGLAAYRGVNLGQQRCRDLNEVHPALVAGCRESGHVADDAATQSYDRGLAVMPGRQQAIEDQLEGFPVFPGLAIRQNHGRGGITAQALQPPPRMRWSDRS